MPSVDVSPNTPAKAWLITTQPPGSDTTQPSVLDTLDMRMTIAPAGYRTTTICYSPVTVVNGVVTTGQPTLEVVISRTGYPDIPVPIGDYVIFDGSNVTVMTATEYQNNYALAGGTAPQPPAPTTPTKGLLAGATYLQSAAAPGTNAADYTNMNNGTADAVVSNDETGCPGTSPWIVADCGTVLQIEHVVLGYDYLDSLGGGPWGSAAFDGAAIWGCAANTAFTTPSDMVWSWVATLESSGATNGLLSVVIAGNYRYLMVNATAPLAVTEFEIWTPVTNAPSVERVLS